MDILVFSDLHGNKKQFEGVKAKSAQAEIVLCAGDLTVFEDNIDHLLQGLNSLGKYTLIVHGNHETDEIMREKTKDLNYVKVIHRKVFKFKNMLFFGWGGGGFSETDPDLEKKTAEFEKVLKGNDFVFLTHAPPYKTSVDLVNGSHVGSKTFRGFIERTQPRMCVCGHIHDTAKKAGRIGKTLVVNPGPEGTIVKISMKDLD